MGTSKYVREKDQKNRWKLSKCRDTRGRIGRIGRIKKML